MNKLNLIHRSIFFLKQNPPKSDLTFLNHIRCILSFKIHFPQVLRHFYFMVIILNYVVNKGLEGKRSLKVLM